MHKKMLSAVMAAVMIFTMPVCFSSCSGSSEYPVTIGSITVDSEPENIVILDKNLADIISCMGYDIKMTGRSDEVTQKGLQVVPSVGSANDPSPASIDKAKADVVFASNALDSSVKEKIESLGITVAVFDSANTSRQVKNLYKKIGKILGGNNTGKKQGKESYMDLSSTMKDVKEAAQSDSVVKTVCYLYIDNGVLKTVNNGTWGATVLNYTGAVNVFKNSESDIVDNSQFLLANPDYIFCSDENVVKYLKSSDVFSSLNALKNNTFVVPYDDIIMQGFTALDVLENMLRDMYPEDFSD